MENFNFFFQRTWNRILAMIKNSLKHEFIFFLNFLNRIIFVMIQSMQGFTLPSAFDISIRVEKYLIKSWKIALRSLVPIFLEVKSPTPIFTPFIWCTTHSNNRLSCLHLRNCCSNPISRTLRDYTHTKIFGEILT